MVGTRKAARYSAPLAQAGRLEGKPVPDAIAAHFEALQAKRVPEE